MNPRANGDDTEFTWCVPKIHRIRGYVTAKLGWRDEDVDKTITPVVNRFADRNRQARLDQFGYITRYEDGQLSSKIVSDRLKKSVSLATGSPAKGTTEQVNGKDVLAASKAKKKRKKPSAKID